MSEVSTGVVSPIAKARLWRPVDHTMMTSDPFSKDRVLTLTDRGKDRFFFRYALATKHADGGLSDVRFHDNLPGAVDDYMAACRREDVKP